MKADHVVYDTKEQAFHCKHCGDTYKPALPAPLSMVVSMAKEYAKAHRWCQPKGDKK